jgi:hypothetical protein
LGVFENRVLRRIFGSKRDEVTGELKRLRKRKLYTRYSSQNIIQVITSRTLKWAGHVASMNERRGSYKVLAGKLREEDHLKDQSAD